MKDKLIEYLNRNSPLSQEEKMSMVELFQVKTISKDKFWIRQNDTCNDIAFLASGILRIFQQNDEIEEITLEFVLPGSFTTALGIKHDNKSPWNFEAMTDCELLLIDKKKHRSLVEKNAYSFDFYEKQLINAYIRKEKQLVSFLHLKAEERLEILIMEQPKIFNMVPLKHIASSLGITPETLSRLRKKLVKPIS